MMQAQNSMVWGALRMAGLSLSIACLPAFVTVAGAATLDAGTVIPVRLNTALNSKYSQQGDTFTATVESDRGRYDLPHGTRIEGVVRMARPQSDNRPGVLDLEFRRLRLPDGESYPIEGSLIGLDNKSVRQAPDGRLVATPDHKNDRLTYVGYGAGAGLVAGLLTRRPVSDTILGGGLGLLFGSLQKGHSNARDVDLKAGTEMGVRMDQTVVVAAYGGKASGDPGEGSDNGGRYHRTETGPNRLGDGTLNEIGVLIGDRNVEFAPNAQPFMSKSEVLVPIRPVLRAANVPFTYDRARRAVEARGENGPVRLAVGSTIAVMDDGRRVRLNVPAQRLNGTIYVPIRFIALATGRQVRYDAGSRTVVIDAGSE